MRCNNIRNALALLTTLVFVSGVTAVTAAQASPKALNGFAPITTDNVEDLEIGYAVPGICAGRDATGKLLVTLAGIYDIASGKTLFKTSGTIDRLSPDGKSVGVHADGIYDLASGQKRFAIQGVPIFSRDGALVAVDGDAVYDVASGQKRFAINGTGIFNQDGTLVATQDGLYDVASGKMRFAIKATDRTYYTFSPDDSLLAVADDAVYDIASGQKRFAITSVPVFSPDGKLLGVSKDGVYDVASGQKRYSITNDLSSTSFSSDGSLLAVIDDGVYDAVSGQKRYAIASYPIFSPDGSLLVLPSDGIYDAATGQKRFAIADSLLSFPSFNPDGSLVAVWSDGIYNVEQGKKVLDMPYAYTITPFYTDLISFNVNFRAPDPYCVLVGLKSDPWPMSQNFVVTGSEPVNLYKSPSLNAHLSKVDPNTLLVVIGQSSDGQWDQLGDQQWIPVSAVRTVPSAGHS